MQYSGGGELSVWEKNLLFEFPFSVEWVERMDIKNTALCTYYIIPEEDADKQLWRDWLDASAGRDVGPSCVEDYESGQEIDDEEVDGERAKDKATDKMKTKKKKKKTRKKTKKGKVAAAEEDGRTVEGALGRAIGSMYAMAIGDALGAPLEFSAYISPYDPFVVRELVVPKKPPKPPKKGKRIKRKYKSRKVGPEERAEMYIHGFEDEHQWERKGYNKFRLLVGQWTDDASMGNCLADSLLISYPKFNPLDLRLRFLNWWQYGYGNAFGQQHDGGRNSVGLGGNISKSITEFYNEKTRYTTAGDRNTSGNGSIMRMCAVPIAFHDDIARAKKVAHKQSKTTHQGDEAACCAQIMAYIIVRAINEGASSKESILSDVAEEFKDSECYSITCLAASRKEGKHSSNKGQKLAKDRNWNWKAPKYRYAATRAEMQPGYVGSYAMDGLAMALHCVWTTSTFKECMLKAINMRGDSDTVGSIAGQLAGALYGAEGIPREWFDPILRWDRRGDFASRAIKLFEHTTISLPAASEEEMAMYKAEVVKVRARKAREAAARKKELEEKWASEKAERETTGGSYAGGKGRQISKQKDSKGKKATKKEAAEPKRAGSEPVGSRTSSADEETSEQSSHVLSHDEDEETSGEESTGSRGADSSD